jgi:type I restriction enzyme M protein
VCPKPAAAASGVLRAHAASLDAPSTRELWVYDFRTNQHFTLKTQPLTREHLNDFVAQYRPDERHKRQASETFPRWTYEELDARPDFNLDVWAHVEDKSLEEAAQIPPPEVLAEEIIRTISAALNEFATVAAEFGVDLEADATPS